MQPILHRNPDMLLETLALLYLEPKLAQDDASLRALFCAETCQGLHSRYVAAFRARKKVFADWQTFVQMTAGEYLLLVFVVLQTEDFLFVPQTDTVGTFAANLNNSFAFGRDTGVPFIDFGGANTVSEYAQTPHCSAAFRALLQDPSAFLAVLRDIVRDNLSAAELAWDSVRTEVRAFADKYWRESYFFAHSVFAADSGLREIYPMLAVPSSAFLSNGVGYCGFYNVDTGGDEHREDEKAFLADCLKALSDPKRLEIAILIAQQPRYNRELAQLTALTPATVMHHTDKLLQCGLISVAADPENQKKMYFKIEREKIEKLKTVLGEIFG